MTDMEVDYYNWCGTRRHGHIDITKREWIKWWNATGVYHLRGRDAGCVTMHRIDTSKPFSLSNIELRTLRTPKRKYMAAQKVVIESMNNELEIQKKLKEEWKELALDLMQKYMTKEERDQFLADMLTTYVEKKVRA